ncbi:polysaccharide deacetylase family protein [Nocardiopsis sp. EMB25]|uniref:polysaccharide deacetylase family protein n=1 Tax=Nocardiopsis sp. EMB25 TaxID=2835867 RepID=UPI0022840FFA|nr:polysaccharide deacetylase family protein [Nocardiopsis sp. EMB25]MCY9783866.1 polysaccharide deacetylase family protein [Nocardiopsis sp. EMB25]
MVPVVAVTSLRRNVTAGVALGLLLVPGCHAAEHRLPHAEAISLPFSDVPGAAVGEHVVETDHSVVGYRYPLLGAGHPLTEEVRTVMAARQTAFLEELSGSGRPELRQDVSLLAASQEVVGTRLTAVSTAGMRESRESSTLWFDAGSGAVLPWTALFRDEEAVERVHVLLADVLREDYHLPLADLPGVVGEAALRATEEPGAVEEAEGAESSPDTAGAAGAGAARDGAPSGAFDAERAREAADAWSGSPLEDVAFSTAGGLTVRMDPTQVPGAGQVSDVMLPVEPQQAEELLSELGFHAREAALSGPDPDVFLEEGPSAEGGTLDCERLKCVALTFDDGPGEHTDALMDTLAEYDAQATFYVLGSLVEEFPEALERMAAEGHELGNHTWEHDDLSGMSAKDIEADMARTNAAVRDVIGVDPPSMRPPYGALNGTVRETVGLPIILWDVDTLDWRSRNTDEVAEHAISHSTSGSVVLFHDIHESSVRAIPDVLDELHRQGFHFVTVTELFEAGLEPGDVYTDARHE